MSFYFNYEIIYFIIFNANSKIIFIILFRIYYYFLKAIKYLILAITFISLNT